MLQYFGPPVRFANKYFRVVNYSRAMGKGLGYSIILLFTNNKFVQRGFATGDQSLSKGIW